MRAKNIKTLLVAGLLLCLGLLITPEQAAAIIPITTPEPKAGQYGLEATKTQPPPTTPATISVPGNGSNFSTSPITVSGICQDGLYVQVYNNGVMVGSIDCKGGSFSVKITLFTGTNEITAIVFDDLDQAGPVSNSITVNYNNASITSFGQLITLTSAYGRRSANPGSTLTWPLQLSGGSGPYAFSIDWGDGQKPELKSQASSGNVEISHVYSKAGIYHVTVTVTDANGVSAFIQLVAIANGNVSTGSSKGGDTKATTVATKVLWLPALIACLLLLPAFWLGRRSQIVSLRKKMEKQVADYKES
jgi:PKD repeat protein